MQYATMATKSSIAIASGLPEALTDKQRDKMARVDGPIHLWFDLTYASYAVQPRSVLQSMPVSWQERFVALMEEAQDVGYKWPAEGTYSVQLRDDRGKFIKDPLRHYRRAFIEPEPGEAP